MGSLHRLAGSWAARIQTSLLLPRCVIPADSLAQSRGVVPQEAGWSHSQPLAPSLETGRMLVWAGSRKVVGRGGNRGSAAPLDSWSCTGQGLLLGVRLGAPACCSSAPTKGNPAGSGPAVRVCPCALHPLHSVAGAGAAGWAAFQGAVCCRQPGFCLGDRTLWVPAGAATRPLSGVAPALVLCGLRVWVIQLFPC